MSAQNSWSSEQISSLVTVGRDAFALVRDALLTIFGILLLIFPSAFNDILVRAGFEEGTFGGMKWKNNLVNADAAMKESRVQITNLQNQLKITADKLNEAESRMVDPAFKASVEKIEKDAALVKQSADVAKMALGDVIQSNAQLVERIAINPHTQLQGSQWGVIYSGDQTIDKARYEVEDIARKYEIPNATIFLDRNGSYRSVSVVSSGAEANRVLPNAKKRRDDAYVVNMANWCPNQIQMSGYIKCAGGR